MESGSIFSDQYITLSFLRFDERSGNAFLQVTERTSNVGFYYITVVFQSGDQVRIAYDGGNPNRLKDPVAQSSHRQDFVSEIRAIRVRD